MAMPPGDLMACVIPETEGRRGSFIITYEERGAMATFVVPVESYAGMAPLGGIHGFLARMITSHAGAEPPLMPCFLCDVCLGAPATGVIAAPWGGDMGICAACDLATRPTEKEE